MLGMFRNLIEYRYFVISSIRNELVTRFTRSKLGGLWVIINPLSQVAIYALILSNVLSAKLPGIESKFGYAIYLMAGLLAWTFFADTINRCLNLFIENGNLMKKMQFPHVTLPMIVVGTNTVNNILLFIAILGVFLLLGHSFSIVMIWLLPLTILLAGFSVSVGLILGVLNVFVRDFSQLVPIILQMLFWFTPIVYPASIIPEEYHALLDLNPVYHFTNAYQDILVYSRTPSLNSMVTISGLTLALLILSLYLFRKSSEEIADVL
jgi:lipopolysaccharide transport system permease protein